jgi:antitoxin ParD1/3/4
MATMNISLPDEMKALVDSRVKTGMYANASDYVRDLIRDDFDDSSGWTPNAAILAALDEAEANGLSAFTIDEIIEREFAKSLTN